MRASGAKDVVIVCEASNVRFFLINEINIIKTYIP